jgi:hypothetical protein|tara:strand:- start:1706 stop:2491 length:786 start_codon:yes stop_codon:yes gene_type:complete
MSVTIDDIKKSFDSEDFQKKYKKYLKNKDNELINFLDSIEINKKYYRMGINKNQKYKKEITEDTQSIKKITSLINKITDTNYETIKKEIIDKINVDYIIPYIIEKLAENSMVHHIYIPQYVGLLKEIKSHRKNTIILRTCNKYYTEFFHTNENNKNGQSNYLQLCAKNKRIDNIIGFSLFISHLEKENIIDNFIEKVLDPFVNNLSSMDDVELYKMLVSFYNISQIHYTIIPNKYKIHLDEIKESTKTPKIRFKIMDILNE